MHYLYGLKKGAGRHLVATFGSQQQLLAYVGWGTLKSFGERRGKFEHGSALSSYDAWEHSTEPLTDDNDAGNDAGVVYNPTPSMLQLTKMRRNESVRVFHQSNNQANRGRQPLEHARHVGDRKHQTR